MNKKSVIKRLKKTLVILTSIVMVTNMTACGNNIKPYTINSEDWVESEQWNNILSMSDVLINIRYNGYAQGSLEKYRDYIDAQTYDTLIASLENQSKSKYYDIEDIYQEELKSLKEAVANEGGILNDDLTVTFNGITSDIFENSIMEPVAETSQNNVDVVQSAVTTPDISNMTEENIDETQGIEVETEVYEEEEIIDPRMTNLISLDGVKIWSAKTQGEIDIMTAEENEKFNELYADFRNSYTNHYKQVVEDIDYKNSIVDEDTGDTHETHIFKYNKDSILELTSNFIQVIDGKHVISWRYIVDNYNKETNRFNYNILGADKFIDVGSEANKLSSLINIGDEAYKFERKKFELLDNKLVNIEYMSYVNNGTLKYDLVLCGTIENNKLKLDTENIAKILDIYE